MHFLYFYSNAKIHADFMDKNFIYKNVTEICTFLLLLMFVKLFCL